MLLNLIRNVLSFAEVLLNVAKSELVEFGRNSIEIEFRTDVKPASNPRKKWLAVVSNGPEIGLALNCELSLSVTIRSDLSLWPTRTPRGPQLL